MNEVDVKNMADDLANEIVFAMLNVIRISGEDTSKDHKQYQEYEQVKKSLYKKYAEVLSKIARDRSCSDIKMMADALKAYGNSKHTDAEYVAKAEEKLKELGFTKLYRTQVDVNYWNKTTYPLGEDGQAMITHVYLNEDGKNSIRINLGNVCLTQSDKSSMSVSLPIQAGIGCLLEEAKGIAKQKLDEIGVGLLFLEDMKPKDE